MNLGMFFEGTGQGVAGKITNVTRLRDLCAADARQKLHLEAGPGTHFGSEIRWGQSPERDATTADNQRIKKY